MRSAQRPEPRASRKIGMPVGLTVLVTALAAATVVVQSTTPAVAVSPSTSREQLVSAVENYRAMASSVPNSLRSTATVITVPNIRPGTKPHDVVLSAACVAAVAPVEVMIHSMPSGANLDPGQLKVLNHVLRAAPHVCSGAEYRNWQYEDLLPWMRMPVASLGRASTYASSRAEAESNAINAFVNEKAYYAVHLGFTANGKALDPALPWASEVAKGRVVVSVGCEAVAGSPASLEASGCHGRPPQVVVVRARASEGSGCYSIVSDRSIAAPASTATWFNVAGTCTSELPAARPRNGRASEHWGPGWYDML